MVFMEGGCAQVMLICEFLEVYMSIHLHSIVDDKRIPDIIWPSKGMPRRPPKSRLGTEVPIIQNLCAQISLVRLREVIDCLATNLVYPRLYFVY